MLPPIGFLPLVLFPDSPEFLGSIVNVFRNMPVPGDAFHLWMAGEFLFEGFCVVEGGSFSGF